ncbi:PREDICTED: 17-beta-hydroxysteroid dehydrogenase 13-like [Nicrophorus vespilloides]|uniref:17-beta-hydroxysteroid dehydrogenase 13-like n=1 Tax=Nicrophorus vespilloides TaxID=110193 RepID=A0ABM1M140_NICVS|nr:PREDICTED: 17-beta-hydroxysteroid dehydrogenase 13-like [Nicrophorus vespilloides]
MYLSSSFNGHNQNILHSVAHRDRSLPNLIRMAKHTKAVHKQEISAFVQARTVLQIIGEILLLLLKLAYFNIESIYRIFVPATEVSVKGEVVLVTGAGHGIGKQIALQYASHGATVVAWDINEANNIQTIKEIEKKGYSKAYSYICDVASRENVFETVKQVEKEVGDISIIVNNAGIMPCHKLLDHTKEEIERIFNINVFAHLWIIQAILPSMLKNKRGHIVALSSVAGIVGLENLVPYCSSKFAVCGLMEALYVELSEYKNCNIKTTVLCPYIVDTGLCKKPKVRFENTMQIVTPEDAAAAVISAQRRSARIETIPGYLLYLQNSLRCASAKFALSFKSFLDTGIEAD